MSENLDNLVIQTRRDILRMVHAVNSGHPGGSLGCVEFFVTLYNKIMEHDEDNISRDMFILSNGHISPVYYSTLARAGYFEIKELNTFRKINSRLQGHPTNHDNLPGVNISSGSLGQGLSVGIGVALNGGIVLAGVGALVGFLGVKAFKKNKDEKTEQEKIKQYGEKINQETRDKNK